MTEDKRFQLSHVGESKYEYDHRDGSTVKVVIDELQNGARIGAYHYSEEGDKLNYHRFRINNVDERKVVAENFDDTESIDDAVLHAFHSGGWDITNLYQTDLSPDKSDPLGVQFLDIRDGFYSYAEQSDAGILTELFNSLARAVEIAFVVDVTLFMGDEEGEGSVEEWESALADKGVDNMNLKDHVEGWFINAVRPETQRSTEQHDAIVEAAEQARNQYRQGADYAEEFDTRYNS